MKKITIDHLERVEGCGGITVTIDEKIIRDVKFNIFEGPRFFERLIIGKTPEEVVSLVPRICGICSISHRYAALRALEKALSIQVPRKIKLLRELMHLGEIIESHSLHIFLLALPDLAGYPSAIAMVPKFNFEVKIGLEMKHFGNRIMEVVSGRYIHGENPVLGGFGKFPSKQELIMIKERAKQFMPFVLKAVNFINEFSYPDSPESDMIFVALNPPNNEFGFVGNEILISDGSKINVQDYKKLTNEFGVSHSFAKHSLYKGKSYSVGALARIILLGDRLKGNAGKLFKKYYSPRWKKNPLYINQAQVIEILYALERIPILIDEINKLPDSPIIRYKKESGKSAGAVEAPRGTLFHYYEVSGGKISYGDIVTPTAQNTEDIEKHCYLFAQDLLNKGQEKEIEKVIKMVVRAYDPCISCSVHLVKVKKALEHDWRRKLALLKKKNNIIYIGLGNPERGDDGAGIELALQLKKCGMKNVLLGDNKEKSKIFLKSKSNWCIIYLDAVDFGGSPGKITIIPLHYVLLNSVLSHRLSPFLSSQFTYEHIKNSFLLAIQPGSIEKKKEISPPVRSAIKEIINYLKN